MATINEKIKRKKTRLDMYYAAEEEILSGAQSYSIGSRALTKANLAEIKNMIDKLETEIDELEKQNTGRKPRRAFCVVPRDF